MGILSLQNQKGRSAGTYTPTLTGITANFSALDLDVAFFAVSGTVAQVWGTVSLTTTGVAYTFDVSLPFGRIANAIDLNGTASTETNNDTDMDIFGGNVATNAARILRLPVSGIGARVVTFRFGYVMAQ